MRFHVDNAEDWSLLLVRALTDLALHPRFRPRNALHFMRRGSYHTEEHEADA